LESLDINQDPIAKKVFLEEFIKGSKNGKLEITASEVDKLDAVKQKLKHNYKWNENLSVAKMAGQNCMDMLVEVGK
jgi:hypothetical protein